jgi:hypothetical protein
MEATGAAPNSRESLKGAGWVCPAGRFKAFVPPKRPLSWLQPRMLWESRNDVVAKRVGDPVNDLRRAWMRAVTEKAEGEGDPRRIDRMGKADVSFMVIGDPGEGDASQWATIPPLEAIWEGTDFAVIMSDVIYPAGNANEYEEKFYRPYREYPSPIYAIPGNHDWYDELRGFMYHLCGLEEMAPPDFTYASDQPAWKQRIHWLFRLNGPGRDLPTGSSTPIRCGSSASTPGSSAASIATRASGSVKSPATRAGRRSS